MVRPIAPTPAEPWLIAEIGVNHDGDPERARSMLRVAAAAGFDAVKLQHWHVEELLAADAPNAPYQGTGDQRDLLASLRLDVEDLASLREEAGTAGVAFLCTADGEQALADVLALRPEAVKIGSGDADNPWLIEAAVASGLPLIVSTGMATDGEVDELVARLAPAPHVYLLHCVSAYPTALDECRLGRMGELAVRSGRPVGFSDHTVGLTAAAASIALGAVVVEKHVTWSATAPGPDHAASLPLDEAPAWVAALRELALGVHRPALSADEEANRAVVRKALYARRDLARGASLEAGDLVPLRPLGAGIPAGRREALVGRRLSRPVAAGRALSWADIES